MLAILSTHPIQYQVPLWQALARDGRVSFEVWYLTAHATQPSKDREFSTTFAWDIDMLAGYPHRFLKTPPGATPSSFWECRICESVAQRVRDQKVTALWIQGWQVAAYWQAVWDARRAGAEVWLRAESNDLKPVPPWKRAIKQILLGAFFRRVDHFLCIGSPNRRLYRSYGVPESKLHDAPYAVDNERFARQAEAIRNQRAEIRSQWGIPDDAFCVLFCGKFIPKKRPMDLVRAAQLLRTNYAITNNPPNIHLLFVGSGELGGEMRASCSIVFDADTNLTSDVRSLTSETKPRATFTGFLNQTEISKAYVAADCLVLPSDYEETWGLVVNEAMASGLPCLISNRAGCSEDLGRMPTNSVYPCGDERALAQAISTNVTEPTGENSPQVCPPSLSATALKAIEIYSRA